MSVTTGYSDVTPPVTMMISDPAAPNGSNGWFTDPPTITFSADETATTYYRWADGDAWSTYESAVTADTQGTSVLQYYSKDKPAGNEEVPRTQQFLLDTDAPAAPGDVVA